MGRVRPSLEPDKYAAALGDSRSCLELHFHPCFDSRDGASTSTGACAITAITTATKAERDRDRALGLWLGLYGLGNHGLFSLFTSRYFINYNKQDPTHHSSHHQK